MDLKPTSDQLMNSIGGGLSVYAGIQAGKRLPEGTMPSGAGYADTSPTSAYSYYPATTELAMYGGGAYPGAARSSTSSMHSSRPKAKVRSNAGKTTLSLFFLDPNNLGDGPTNQTLTSPSSARLRFQVLVCTNNGI